MPHWTSAAGVPIAFDDRGAGRPLVLVHAFPLDRRMWEPQAELAETCRLLTPDLFGCGESGLAAGGWTVDTAADTLAEWLTALGLDKVLFGGLSMGGYVALAFARRHPNRVLGLLLADTRAEADTPEGKANRAKAIQTVADGGPAALVEQMLPNLLSGRTRQHRPAVEGRVREIARSQSADGVTAAIAALRDRPDATAVLAGFKFPVLVIVGADDVLTPPTAAESMADKLPDVTRETLGGAGHFSNLEAPVAFNAAVRRWVAAVA